MSVSLCVCVCCGGGCCRGVCVRVGWGVSLWIFRVGCSGFFILVFYVLGRSSAGPTVFTIVSPAFRAGLSPDQNR